VSRALVTGVSGAVGPALARRLATGGFDVRALVRSDEQSRAVADAGWSPVCGDLLDATSLTSALTDVEVVVHAAAYLGADWDLAQAVNVEGTAALARAARAAGVARFVHISTMSAHGEPQPDGLHERSPLAVEQTIHPYVATKARAEVVLSELRAPGFTTAALRPGAICSVNRSAWGDRLVQRLRDQGWPAHRHPNDVIPWVHTDDLAEMTYLCALHPGASDEVFLAVDANVELADFLVPICDALGVAVTTPPRQPVVSRCRIGAIRKALGYTPAHDPEATIRGIVDLATAHAR
jgi:nucleoside-diphosphate-sugar epimerase